MARDDSMMMFAPLLADFEPTDPWQHDQGETPIYGPDYGLLGGLLSLSTAAGSASESGVFAKGIDLWISAELRRAGFSDHEVWPRLRPPRVLPSDLAALVDSLPQRVKGVRDFSLKDEIERRIGDLAQVTPTEARILGRAYEKQVDVCITRWKTGPEILVSTKAQVSSFGKNLPNRFEESLGDAENLQARHPLAAIGYFFVQRSTILTKEPESFERTKDMVEKLRIDGSRSGYTATALCLVEWDDEDPEGTVAVRLDEIPEYLRPEQFFHRMIGEALRVTPVTFHRLVRERYERRAIPVEDETED